MDNVPLVFDNGSGMIKAGFANQQDAPSVVFPSIVGRRKRHFGVMGQKDVYVGDEAIERSHMLKLNRPIEKGCVVNWGDMEELWRHTFNDELHVAPEEQPVLLTEAVLVKLSTQEKIQTMFEKFNVPATYVALSAVLSLIASGSETGIVIDSGEGVTQVVPVFEGHVAPYAVGRMYLAGGDITENLRKTLTERGYLFRKDNDGIEDVRDIKEALSYMALHYDEELRSARDSSSIENNYQLPDGQTITIGSERFRCAELFYQPHIIGMEPTGIQKVVEESISHHTPRAKKALYENILLSGGSTMFPGFADRLKKEIAALVPNTMNVNVVAPPERKYSTWVGGAIFASMSSTKEKWITKSEYEEHGPSIVDKKCNYRLNGGFFIDHHVK